MAELLKTFYSPFVVLYLIGVGVIPLIVSSFGGIWQRITQRKRAAQGLDEKVLLNPATQLRQQRKLSTAETVTFLTLVGILPFGIITLISVFPESIFTQLPGIKGMEGDGTSKKSLEIQKINLAFASLLIWTLVSGTTIAQNFLGGIAFRAISSITRSIQVGDRATLEGHHGIVKEINIFTTKLQTLNDDLVSIPSAKLLDSVVSSTNAGDRSSLCVFEFFLEPENTPAQVQEAENAIWESIQSSTYYDFNHQIKIFLKQTETSLILTAKAYVCSTYDEPEFVTGVTKRVLRVFHEKQIKTTRRRSLQQHV